MTASNSQPSAAPAESVPAALRTITTRCPNLYTLRLDCALAYQPGQSVQVLLPGDSKPRYFSISSSPTEPGFLEITLKADPNHPLAPVIAKLKRGDAVKVTGPLGSLRLPQPLSHPICFVAAGTGVTPFRSMIRYLLDTNASIDRWLFHSVKTPSDLLFADEFADWAGAEKRFHYVPTITQDFDDNWKNETGRINEALLRKHVPKSPTIFYLCGPGAFVADMEKLLRGTMGVPAEHVRREQW